MPPRSPLARATVRRPTPAPNLLRRILSDFDATTPDGLLLTLTDHGATRITIRSTPRRGLHGHHAVTWTRHGTTHTNEAATLAAALRAAIRSAQPRPGDTP